MTRSPHPVVSPETVEAMARFGAQQPSARTPRFRRPAAVDPTRSGPPPAAQPPAAPAAGLATDVAETAHDFNNLLSVILVCAGEIAAQAPDPVQRERAEEIRIAARHGAELTRDLLDSCRAAGTAGAAAGRRDPLRPEESIATAMTQIGAIVQRTLGEGIRLIVDAPPTLPHVPLTPSDLERMLVNLAANARAAMPHGGAVAIHAATVSIADPEQRLSPGRYVRLSFSDSGVGMDAETAARALDPYFTTRGASGGSGLGLASVHGIAQEAGGEVRLNSGPGLGTTVSVYLPAL